MFQCRFSSRPCCGKEASMFGVMGEDYTCSVFDTGRCEPIKSFKNIKKLLELVSQLNENNYEELRIEYFRDLQRLEREQAAVKPTAGPVVLLNAMTEFMPKCIKHYHRVSKSLLSLALKNRSSIRLIELVNTKNVVCLHAAIDD